jgi:ketosteroid isomerase-like protein
VIAAVVLVGTSFSQAAGRSAQSQANPVPAANPTDAAVIAASQQWFDAINNGDVKTLEEVETEDFQSFQQTPQGVTMMSKRAQIELMLKAPAANRVKLQRDLGMPRIRNYGSVAILTAVATFRGQNSAGRQIASQSLVTEVWVNAAGKWRISHFQPLVIPPKPATPPTPTLK